ncbi:GntR family transcriptional regulator [Clostridiaceae bacterium]|jgi:DNA-binding GntR family transcriptional regulator|nr:GntR family transcriptional regulator [Clostridium sp.]NBI72781.1 GntR family transcriptional regulator [Clostridiaceae bacterium]
MRDSDVAYEKIKMMIITARLKPGEAVVEARLMETLGMGRTPIREALNRLAWENFVKIIPRQCIMVNEISIYEVESIYQMRFALAPLESELAALNRTDRDLEHLKKDIEALSGETDPQKRVLLDRAFHRTVSSMTKNPFLEKEMNNYQDLSIRLLFLNQVNLSAIDDMDIGTHEKIYRYIQERDRDKLIQVQKNHVLEFKRKFIHS